MQNFLVPANLFQALHDHLVREPMVEIEGLVVALRQCHPHVPEQPKPAPESPVAEAEPAVAKPEVTAMKTPAAKSRATRSAKTKA